MVFSASRARASISSGYLTQSVSRILLPRFDALAVDLASFVQRIGQQFGRQGVDVQSLALADVVLCA